MIRKWLAVGINILAVVLLVLGSLSNAVGYQTTRLRKLETTSYETNNEVNKNLREKTTYRFCHLESGNVRHKGFDGWFIGYPTTHFGFSHFGIGSFTLVLQRDYFTDDNELTLKITQLTTKEYNDSYIIIKMNLFVGYYQPTGGLGDGTLYGHALCAKILYNGDNPE